MPLCAFRNMGHQVTPVAAVGRSGEFAVSTTGDQVRPPSGRCRRSTQGGDMQAEPVAQLVLQPGRLANLGVDHVLLDITAPIDDQIEAMRQLLKLTTVV
jgi:hypothetical protein